jgi:hypothetical protein
MLIFAAKPLRQWFLSLMFSPLAALSQAMSDAMEGMTAQ